MTKYLFVRCRRFVSTNTLTNFNSSVTYHFINYINEKQGTKVSEAMFFDM